MSKVLDKMNDTLVYAVEEFDKKYTEFGGIILESPFTSMINAAKNIYPWLPVKYLLKDNSYPSISGRIKSARSR